MAVWIVLYVIMVSFLRSFVRVKGGRRKRAMKIIQSSYIPTSLSTYLSTSLPISLSLPTSLPTSLSLYLHLSLPTCLVWFKPMAPLHY